LRAWFPSSLRDLTASGNGPSAWVSHPQRQTCATPRRSDGREAPGRPTSFVVAERPRRVARGGNPWWVVPRQEFFKPRSGDDVSMPTIESGSTRTQHGATGSCRECRGQVEDTNTSCLEPQRFRRHGCTQSMTARCCWHSRVCVRVERKEVCDTY